MTPVARRLSDRAVFIWGVIWNIVVALTLTLMWVEASRALDALWVIVSLVSVLASSALTIAISRVDATLVVSLAPAMLVIALPSVNPAMALAVWGTAYFVGALVRIGHLGDAAEMTAYVLGGALVVASIIGPLQAAGVPQALTVIICVGMYLLVRLMMSSIRLVIVVHLTLREVVGELLLMRTLASWSGISLVAIAGLAIQQLAMTHTAPLDMKWGGALAMLLLGIAAFAIGVHRESRIANVHLSGTIDAALSLPWPPDEPIDQQARRFAQRALPWYTVEVRRDEERNVNELVAPMPGGYLVARRGSIHPPFLVQEQRVLDAIAHIADTMAATRSEKESLSLAAATDGLTGLPNYRSFRESLTTLARRTPDGIAVVYVDVDGFKEINDRHGHEAGNAVLRRIADRLRDRLPETDLVARVGGDEFVLVLTGIPDEETGRLRAAALLDDISAPVLVGRSVVALHLSSGVAFAEPGCTDITALVGDADARMYAARGRAVADAPAVRPARTDLEAAGLVASIAAAIRDRRLTVLYQPVVDGEKDVIVAVEALVRANDPALGELPADLIVHEARRLQLLTQLSLQVLDTAVADLRRFQRIAPGLAHLTLNVDVEQVTDPGYLDAVAHAGGQGVELTLELSETSLNRTSDDLNRALERLRADAGVRIALDDFGRDSSTLLSLLQYPLDVLKIDRALIRGMQTRKPQLVMLSLVRLARSLGIQMVVEGVEDENTYDELVRAGVRLLQGYRFGRPMPADQFAERLERHGLRAYLP